jgi:hypothetical protein
MPISEDSSLKRVETTDWWMVCLLLSVLFTPNFRLPGGIPFRLDDLLVFGTGAILAAIAIIDLEAFKPDVMALSLMLLVGAILVSTLLAPPAIAVTAKEYFDILRPLKFLLVYWILRGHDPVSARNTFRRVICVSLLVLFAIACLQLLAVNLSSDGPLVTFFSRFTERDFEDAQTMMATRPFATFDTPVNLGYVAMIGMFLAPQIRSRRYRVLIISVSFLALLISVTRTFLFALPILLPLQAVLRGRFLGGRLKSVSTALALTIVAAVSAALILPVVSPAAADFTSQMIQSVATGDAQSDVSVSTRLENLELVGYTWQNAPLLGVGGRSLLPPFVDSELVLTFHRYGIIGFAIFLGFYPAAYLLAKRTRQHDQEFAEFIVMVLVATFLIGITQAALINSRMGVLPFAILGIAAGWQRNDGQLKKRIALTSARRSMRQCHVQS